MEALMLLEQVKEHLELVEQLVWVALVALVAHQQQLIILVNLAQVVTAVQAAEVAVQVELAQELQ
jgi:hypothetical protein